MDLKGRGVAGSLKFLCVKGIFKKKGKVDKVLSV